MICESCGREYGATFGSGRFCSTACAHRRVFSAETRALKAQKQKAFINRSPETFARARTLAQTVQSRKKRILAWEKRRLEATKAIPFSKLSEALKRLVILQEQEDRCAICQLSSWQDQPIPLELDHINGDRSNNERDNLRMICPNCHAQTDTYKVKNVKKKISDAELLEALLSSSTIYQALTSLGMNAHGVNYRRARRLLAVSSGFES